MQRWLVIISYKAICWSNHCHGQLGNCLFSKQLKFFLWELTNAILTYITYLYIWSSYEIFLFDLYMWTLYLPEQPRTHSEPPWMRHVVVDFSILKFIPTVYYCVCFKYLKIRSKLCVGGWKICPYEILKIIEANIEGSGPYSGQTCHKKGRCGQRLRTSLH